MRHKRPTQKSIAEAAEVSQSLVSMVLNGKTVEVAPETRARILQVAREQKYLTVSEEASKRPHRKVWAYICPLVTQGAHNEHWIYDSYIEFYNKISLGLVEAA